MKIKDQLHKNENKTVDDYLKFNDMNEIKRSLIILEWN